MEIGVVNKLKVLRFRSVGCFLGDDSTTEVLLPNKYVPEGLAIDDEIDVFISLDSEDRLLATTIFPFTQKNEFAFLKVKDVNSIGAFLYWGLEKDLLVPFAEQSVPMEVGKSYVVYVYLDDKSNRIVASSRLNRFVNNDFVSVEVGEEVEVIVCHESALGFNVLVNRKNWGLVYKNEIFENIASGQKRKGYIKQIREDNKLDVSLTPFGHESIDFYSQKVLDYLTKNNGELKLTDKSNPDEIKNLLGMSKKNFKKALGSLYKIRKIVLLENSTKLSDQSQ